MTFSRASLITSLSVTESLSLMSPPCALLPPISIDFRLLHPSSCYRQKLFALDPHRRRQNVDARFRFSSFYDQDLCSINFTTTRRSPREAFFFSRCPCTHRQVRVRRLFSRRKPSDAQVRYEGSGNACHRSYGFFVVFSFILKMLTLLPSLATFL